MTSVRTKTAVVVFIVLIGLGASTWFVFFRTQDVLVEGAVLRPGTYALSLGASPIDAVAAAGGFSKHAIVHPLSWKRDRHLVVEQYDPRADLLNWMIPENLREEVFFGFPWPQLEALNSIVVFPVAELTEEDIEFWGRYLEGNGLTKIDLPFFRDGVEVRTGRGLERWFRIVLSAEAEFWVGRPVIQFVTIQLSGTPRHGGAIESIPIAASHQVNFQELGVGRGRQATPEEVTHLLGILSSEPPRSTVAREFVHNLVKQYGDDEVGLLLSGLSTRSGLYVGECPFLPNNVVDRAFCGQLWSYPELAVSWIELDSSYIITDRSQLLLYSPMVALRDETGAALFQAFEDRARGNGDALDQLLPGVTAEEILAVVNGMPICDPICKVTGDKFTSLGPTISPSEIFEIFEYDPDNASVTEVSIAAYNVLKRSMYWLESDQSAQTITRELREIDLRVKNDYGRSAPSLDLMLAGLIARNVPIYDEEHEEWVSFNTWSKRFITRVSPASRNTRFGNDPIGSVIDMLTNPSAENIRDMLGLDY